MACDKQGVSYACVFRYHMNGATIGSLHVMRQYQVGVSTDGKVQLWSESGPQGDAWKKARVYLGAIPDFTISIEAHRGKLPKPCIFSHVCSIA